MASVNQKQCAVQCWLEEYRSLRTLAESHLTTMRYLVIFNLTALGTIGGLVLSDTTERIWVALIIPILSPFIGFLVYLHSKRTSQIDNYIDRKIAKRIRNIASDTELFGWESYVREKEKKQNVILLTTSTIVNDEVLEELRSQEHVFSARKIEL